MGPSSCPSITIRKLGGKESIDPTDDRSFIGKRGNKKTGFQSFLSHYVEPRAGDLVDVDTGAVVGSHNGIHNFTLGQNLRLRGMRDKVGSAAGRDFPL